MTQHCLGQNHRIKHLGSTIESENDFVDVGEISFYAFLTTWHHYSSNALPVVARTMTYHIILYTPNLVIHSCSSRKGSNILEKIHHHATWRIKIYAKITTLSQHILEMHHSRFCDMQFTVQKLSYCTISIFFK